MSNMSYCRFQNTEKDFSECREYIGDVLSEEENCARINLINEAIMMLDAIGIYVEVQDGDVEKKIAALIQQNQLYESEEG